MSWGWLRLHFSICALRSSFLVISPCLTPAKQHQVCEHLEEVWQPVLHFAFIAQRQFGKASPSLFQFTAFVCVFVPTSPPCLFLYCVSCWCCCFQRWQLCHNLVSDALIFFFFFWSSTQHRVCEHNKITDSTACVTVSVFQVEASLTSCTSYTFIKKPRYKPAHSLVSSWRGWYWISVLNRSQGLDWRIPPFVRVVLHLFNLCALFFYPALKNISALLAAFFFSVSF